VDPARWPVVGSRPEAAVASDLRSPHPAVQAFAPAAVAVARRAAGVSRPDCWACPVCGGDARPGELRACEFVRGVVGEVGVAVRQGRVPEGLAGVGERDPVDLEVDGEGKWHFAVPAERSATPAGGVHMARGASGGTQVKSEGASVPKRLPDGLTGSKSAPFVLD
jgi:hypothetical protein